VLVSFDLNHRVALWNPEAAAAEYRALTRLSDIVFAGQDEAQMLAGDVGAEQCATEIALLGPAQVIIKQGALGYTALVDGRLHSAPAHVVRVVDPVGAGDAFVAGYLAGIVRGESPEAALGMANALGAFAVSVPGDWEGSPTVAELTLLDSPDGAVLR
jgi:2-dehydro-3-deoxygluconokinase